MSEEILMCGTCGGSGMVERSELEDYHNNIYDHWDEKCTTCKGSGRVVKTTTIKYKPYKVKKLRKRS